MRHVLGPLGILLVLFSTAIVRAAGVPAHIPTWAFDEYRAQGKNATAEEVRRYITYAEGGLGNDKSVRDCSGSSHQCFSLFYFDPSLIYVSSECPFAAYRTFLTQASEDWFIHLKGYTDPEHRVQGTYTQTCKGSRIKIPVYEANQANPAVRSFFANYLRRTADAWDYYEMDDTSDSLLTQFYGPGGGFCHGLCASTEELADDDAVVRAHGTFADSLTHSNGSPMKFFFNGLTFTNRNSPVPRLFQRGGQFVGVICENCIVNNGTLRPNMFEKVLDAMAAIDQTPGASFVELNTGKSAAGSDDQITQRLVTTAVAWLGFSEGHTIVWPDLEFNTSNLAVWPEDGIYPTAPVETMSRSAGAISVEPGVWRREFSACYESGKPIGACAAVLNGSGGVVTVRPEWMRLQYHHTIALSGGDTLSGGTISRVSSDTNSVQIQPGQAVLLVR
ncbi:MAG TPA: hypothetical protein VGN11_08620 [Candidatus Baltobacteraceae bacterium]|nr:hypothetical protein [Candidatus Baltobacteraceae bacterium]